MRLHDPLGVHPTAVLRAFLTLSIILASMLADHSLQALRLDCGDLNIGLAP